MSTPIQTINSWCFEKIKRQATIYIWKVYFFGREVWKTEKSFKKKKKTEKEREKEKVRRAERERERERERGEKEEEEEEEEEKDEDEDEDEVAAAKSVHDPNSRIFLQVHTFFFFFQI